MSGSTGQSFPGQNSVVWPAVFAQWELWGDLCVNVHLSRSVPRLPEKIPGRITARVLPLLSPGVTLSQSDHTDQDSPVLTSNQERQHNIWIPASQPVRGKLQSLHKSSVNGLWSPYQLNGHQTKTHLSIFYFFSIFIIQYYIAIIMIINNYL